MKSGAHRDHLAAARGQPTEQRKQGQQSAEQTVAREPEFP
jgi:hypothetical protein